MDITPNTVKRFMNVLPMLTGEVEYKRKPRSKTPPIYQRKVLLNQKDPNSDLKHYVEIKYFLRPPTPEFDKTGCFFQIQNGKYSIFTRTTPEQLLELAAWMENAVKDGMETYNNCKSAETQVIEIAKNNGESMTEIINALGGFTDPETQEID